MEEPNISVQDPEIAALFQNCLPNTLDTTVFAFTNASDPLELDTCVITGAQCF